ncbi:hypothetical protein FHG87_011181 [Trinorchestia longiramus]|nr:hypothetical protein FHG87_011181 [Trinorchestia longiramus]
MKMFHYSLMLQRLEQRRSSAARHPTKLFKWERSGIFGRTPAVRNLTGSLIDADFDGVTVECTYKGEAVLQPLASTSTEQDLGSNHYPIVTSIGIEPSSVRYRFRPSWNFGVGKWAEWSAAPQQPEMPEILSGCIKSSVRFLSPS